MQLTMYLGNDLIEAVPVNLYEISNPGYLGRFKRQLKQRYDSLIQEANLQPEFLVVNLNVDTQLSGVDTQLSGIAKTSK